MHETALEQVKRLESESHHDVPQLLGKMQHAVLLYHYGVHKDDAESILAAIDLVDELLPKLTELEKAVPKREIEGLQLWLLSNKAWCLNHLARHSDAIKLGLQVLDIALNLEAHDEISRSYAQLSRLYEDIGDLPTAYEYTRTRYYRSVAKSDDRILAIEAAEAARRAGKLLKQMNEESPSDKTRSLSEHWYGMAADLYRKIGENEVAESIEKEV